jgi:hypothetical protein
LLGSVIVPPAMSWPAQALELDAGALELGGRACAAQRRLGGHLGRAAAQDAVRQQGVDRSTRLVHRRLHTGQGRQRGKQVGHAPRR